MKTESQKEKVGNEEPTSMDIKDPDKAGSPVAEKPGDVPSEATTPLDNKHQGNW